MISDEMATNADSANLRGETRKTTTVRSQKSAGSMAHSRKSNSIRSMRNSQRSNNNRNSQQRQTNEMYVVGSMDNIQVNYKVDVENQKVYQKTNSLVTQ